MHTPHYSIIFIWCTLPIITKEVAVYLPDLPTLGMAQCNQLWKCTLLIYLLHANSSLFHRLIWCTLLIIPKEVAESKQELHTPSKAQWIQLWQCTLLVNLMDAHLSLFIRLYIIHTPHYSLEVADFTHSCQCTKISTFIMQFPGTFTGCTLLIIPWTLYIAHSSLFPTNWLNISRICTLLPMQKEFNFHYVLSW